MRKITVEAGQIGLILLVVLGLLITLIMSLASRTLSDSVLSRQDKEQSATFAIAESGAEEALKLINDGVVPAGVSRVSDSANLIVGEYNVLTGNVAEIYLREGEVVQANLGGGTTPRFTVSWVKRDNKGENVLCVSEGSGGAPAAIEIDLINTSVNSITRSYYDSYGCDLSSNGFMSATATDSMYLSIVNIVAPSGTDLARVRPIYNGATIRIAGLSPTQQYNIQSHARGGDAQKEIEVKRSLDSAPSVFDFALFSGGIVVK